MKQVLIGLFMGILFLPIRAQDFQLSQFYAAQMLINPGFTANTIQDKLSLNYRNQWPAVPNANPFVTYAFGYEHNFEEFNSGVGLQVFNDKAGIAALRTTGVYGSYAYRFRITRKFSIKPGLQLGYVNRYINFQELVFNDQLQTGASTTSSTQDFDANAVRYLDINAGGVAFTEDFWVGVALHHLNRPNLSMFNGNMQLPVKFSIQGGYNIPLKKNIKKQLVSEFTTAFNYRHQEPRDQLDLGGYFKYRPMMFGIWYRGIPLKNLDAKNINHESVIVLIGYYNNGFRCGYSFDMTVSRLTAATSGGAHEISASYEFANRKNLNKRRRRSRMMIPCPKF
jgi:type IX secretion system PorP/SprF family membrane protein